MLADEELIRAVLAGDVEAFGTLMARYERSICALVRAIIHDRQLAEDAVQESFLAAYRGLPQLKDPRAFGPWLATIVRRRAREMAMKRPQLAALEGEAASEVITAADAGGMAFDQERLLAALVALPEQERAVLMLRHFDGHDAAAIAQITGDSVGTITKRISRGHARLREILKEYQI